jgi:hypothetical protein
MSDQNSHSTSVLERSGATHPDLKIWWDSSPLVFESWRSEMIKAADPERREAMVEALTRLWDPERPDVTEFRGATTNPPPVAGRDAPRPGALVRVDQCLPGGAPWGRRSNRVLGRDSELRVVLPARAHVGDDGLPADEIDPAGPRVEEPGLDVLGNGDELGDERGGAGGG